MLYIPSRVATTSVTERYRDWWLKSISKFFLDSSESTETFDASNTIDHYDNNDEDDELLPLGQVLQNFGESFLKKLERCRARRLAKNHRFKINKDKIGDGGASASTELPLSQLFKKEVMKRTSEHLKNKGRKRAREDDESAAETEDDESADTEDDESAETEDDDNMTIAQRINSRKKSDDIENTEGERSRLVADNNVSGLPQKLAYGDETVATTQEETEQKNNENKSSNGVAAEKEEDDERLKQRKLAIKELALKTEARMLKVENTLAKIKQWKLTRLHTKKPLVSS